MLRATLRNGLRLVVVPDPLAPVVTTEINYLVGSDEAPEGFPGTAHALEHLMFRGSPGLSADQLAYVSAAMGGEFNADTQQALTQFFFTVPSEDLEVALRIEAIRMRGLLPDDALWNAERGAIEQEVSRDLSSPQYRLYTDLLARIFRGTAYAHDALGTKESFDRTTGEALRRFHATWYAPNDAILVVAGDVQPAEVLEKVKSLFGDIPARPLPPRPSIELGPVEPEALRSSTDLPYGLAVVGLRFPGNAGPDWATARVAAHVLSNPRGELYGLVPAGKALSAGFELEGLPAASLGMAVASFPANSDGDAVLKQVEEVLLEARTKGVPADLVEAAKRVALTRYESRRNSVPGLAELWSQALAEEGRTSPDDDAGAIARVTPAEVNAFLRRELDLDHAVTAILTPAAARSPVASAGFGGAESFSPGITRPVALPPWASRAVGRLVVPPSTIHPEESRLPNGLRLIVQREPLSRTVSVFGLVENEPRVEEAAGKEGEAEVLDELFDYGTRSLDRLAFQKALDDIGATASIGPEFSLEVLPGELGRGLELLAEDLVDPALPPQAFAVVRDETEQSLSGLLSSPDWLTHQSILGALYPPGDPSLRHATPESVGGLTLEDIRAYHAKAFRPDLTTIVLIGDVGPKEARSLVESAFGGWRVQGPRPATRLPSVGGNRPSAVTVSDESKVQASVTLTETVGLTRSSPDYYPLALGNQVLGGGFYATRFYRDLREERGLVYTVGSRLALTTTRGTYSVTFGADPDKVATAREVVIRDLEAMRRVPVTSGELRTAKAALVRGEQLEEASIGRIGLTLLALVRQELPLDEPSRAAKRWLALDARSVLAAFQRWIRPEDLVEVVEGPPSQGPSPHSVQGER
ncbi:MAG TPA: pitrilysin family protein [Anaeromyxobacter sp.]|nr:pitrilysin family protein [Anaeromyxobacter sp.]